MRVIRLHSSLPSAGVLESLTEDAQEFRCRRSSSHSLSHLRGGAFSSRSRLFKFTQLSAYDMLPAGVLFSDEDKLRFLRTQNEIEPLADNEVAFRVPLSVFGIYLPVKNLRVVARMHGIGPRSVPLEIIEQNCRDHVCDAVCGCLVGVFERCNPFVRGLQSVAFDASSVELKLPPHDPVELHAFPPVPLTTERCAELTSEWRRKISPEALSELPCSVCARLMCLTSMKAVDVADPLFNLLVNSSSKVARKERTSIMEAVEGLSGPLLCPEGITTRESSSFANICGECYASLHSNRLPTYSLANGQWIAQYLTCCSGSM